MRMIDAAKAFSACTIESMDRTSVEPLAISARQWENRLLNTAPGEEESMSGDRTLTPSE